MNDLISVYCISNSPPELNGNIEFNRLQCIEHDSLYVSIQYVPESEFSVVNFQRNLSDIHWVESHVREHNAIIRLLMEQQPVIPFPFGTLFHTEKNLKCFMEGYSGSIDDNLRPIVEKEEWSVKMYCDYKVLEEKIDELSLEAADYETLIMESSPGKAYLLRRKKDNLIDIEIDRLCRKYAEECYDAIKNQSEANNLRNLIPKEFTGRQELMILNASFLVNKNKAADFRNTLAMLIVKNQHAGFILESSEPSPPFSFISLK